VTMRDFSKSLHQPDETIQMSGIIMDVVDLGDLTVARAIHQPGWRWSTHRGPSVEGDWCQVRHVGLVISGRLGWLMSDGSTYEIETDDVYDIPPGHDGYVIGHEAAEVIEWSGIRAFSGFLGSLQNRVLATLLLTDLVGTTERAQEIGDAAWRDLLSAHLETSRTKLERFRGTEVNTRGNGILATFNSPAQALLCAQEMRRVAKNADLQMRAGVHIGEVEIVHVDVRGMALHETQRIMESAAAGEVLVSDTTRSLALASGLSFEDRGTHMLEGIGARHLWAYASEASSS